MSKIKRNEEDYSNKRFYKKIVILTEQELKALDAELETFRVTKWSNHWQRDLSLIDTNAWMESKGALRNGAVVVSNLQNAVYDEHGRRTQDEDVDPILFQELDEKLRQWTDWKARKEYGQRKRLEQLDTKINLSADR